jgi:probable phosphoglycerate mutase
MLAFFSNFARRTIKTTIMTTLLLVRHGETFDNENQIMQGQTQGQLNPRGIEQAQLLAGEMAQRRIDAFVASDLNRSIETCRIIAEPHHAEVITTPLLRERDWGAFTGRYIPDLKGVPFPDDVESLDALLQRAQRFIDFINERFKGQTVLAVGHGIINKAIQAQFFGKQMREVERMSNAEVRTLMIP